MINSATSKTTASTVTFTLAHSGLNGHRVSVVGDFNGWDPGATPMVGVDGTYTATIDVEPGRYRFRYLSEDGRWFNDAAADDYAPNDHGGEDGILIVAPEAQNVGSAQGTDRATELDRGADPAAAAGPRSSRRRGHPKARAGEGLAR